MKYILLATALLISFHAVAQKDTSSQVLWAFPITSYMVPLEEGVQVVQIEVPPTIKFVQSKQIGVLRGVAAGSNIDTGSKGWGKCHLIKAQYNYFAIHLEGKVAPKEGDLIYTFIPTPAGVHRGAMFAVASHGVTFLNVFDSAFYKPDQFLKGWTTANEAALLDKMVADIHQVAEYYAEEDPTMNNNKATGSYEGKGLLDVMAVVKSSDVESFLRYVAARPRRYAGNTWKVSETFATWLVSGAPTVKEGS